MGCCSTKNIIIQVSDLDVEGNNALIRACRKSDEQEALKLLDTGLYDPDYVNNKGYVAFIWAYTYKMIDVAIAIIAIQNYKKPDDIIKRIPIFWDCVVDTDIFNAGLNVRKIISKYNSDRYKLCLKYVSSVKELIYIINGYLGNGDVTRFLHNVSSMVFPYEIPQLPE